MQKTYVIDGYNVIHAAPPLKRSLRGGDAVRARTDLVNAVAGFAERMNVRCVIVFDGVVEAGAPTQRVDVVSSRERTADDVIRDLAREQGRRLVVVTNDLAILATARANMAEIVPSKAFAANLMLGTHARGLDTDRGDSRDAGRPAGRAPTDGSARPHRIEELRQRSEKPGPLSHDDIEEWKKLFGEE